MKSSIVLALVCWRLSSITGFSIVPSNTRVVSMSTTTTTTTTTSSSSLLQLNMFSGAGAGLPSEDNPEEIAKLEQAAKAMGMSVSEYKLGISARVRLTQELDSTRVTTGKTNIVTIERDGNNPPKFLEIIVTENGKALGPSALSDELVKGLKAASELSRTKRADAQKGMMAYIGDEMKKLGA